MTVNDSEMRARWSNEARSIPDISEPSYSARYLGPFLADTDRHRRHAMPVECGDVKTRLCILHPSGATWKHLPANVWSSAYTSACCMSVRWVPLRSRFNKWTSTLPELPHWWLASFRISASSWHWSMEDDGMRMPLPYVSAQDDHVCYDVGAVKRVSFGTVSALCRVIRQLWRAEDSYRFERRRFIWNR